MGVNWEGLSELELPSFVVTISVVLVIVRGSSGDY